MSSQYPYNIESDRTERLFPRSLETRLRGGMARIYGLGLLAVLAFIWASLISWSAADPSLTHVTRQAPSNVMSYPGAILSDLLLESLGLTAIVALLAPMLWAVELAFAGRIRDLRTKLTFFPLSIFLLGTAFSALPIPQVWPLPQGLGGILGDAIYSLCHLVFAALALQDVAPLFAAALFTSGFAALAYSIGFEIQDVVGALRSAPAKLADPIIDTDGRTEPVFTSAQRAEAHHVHQAAPRRNPDADGPTLLRTDGRPRRVEDDVDADLPPSLNARAPEEAPPHKPESATGFESDDVPPTGRQSPYEFDSDDDTAAIAGRFAPASRKRWSFGASAAAPKTGGVWTTAKPATAKPAVSASAGDSTVLMAADAGPAPVAAPTVTRPAPVQARRPSTVRQWWRNAGDASQPAAVGSAPAPWAEEIVPTVSPSPITGPAAQSPASHAPAAYSNEPARETAQQRRPDAMPYRPAAPQPAYKRPSLHLLEPAPPARPGPELTPGVLRAHTRMLTDALADYGINGEVTEIKQGPVVTLYELEPQRGTKTSRVIALADDIARTMSVSTVRIAAMPGRSAIGIELPNVRREVVHLREILEADTYRRGDGVLPIALGKSIEGTRVVSDLARIPHLLITGASGAGKSVFLNDLIQSLLFRHGPEACRLLLVDTKMLQLTSYNDVPHLLSPVITDPGKAVAALHWVIAEMEERHKRMSKLAVRNIEIFNNRVNNARKRGEMIARTVKTGFDRMTGEPIYEHEQMDLKPMPYIVVVIDEFADMMGLAAAEVEAAVRRIAATAQAVGIHLVMATQDLSASVITQSLSASLRTKICFKTPMKAESRAVLGVSGAEQLLDHGDMLLSSGVAGQCARIHTPYVSHTEIEAVIEFLRASGTADYDAALLDLATADLPENAEAPEASIADHYAQASGPRHAATETEPRRLFGQVS